MKRLMLTPFLFAVALLAPLSAHAAEALEQLKGAWVAESFNGEAPPDGLKVVMTFVDDAILRMEMTFGEETEKQEVKYTATADGKITIFPEPEKDPDGEKATWEIKEKKLVIKSAEEGEDETLVFNRAKAEEKPEEKPEEVPAE